MRYFSFAAAFLGASSFLFAADPALLNLVMPDAQIVAGVNLAKAKTSPFGQFILRQMPEDSDFAKFINASGFDPRRDLQEVLMATPMDQKNGLVAARGMFDPQKISALATADGKHMVSQYNGAQLLVSTEAGSPALAFFDGSFAVAGDLVSVKAAVDRRKSHNAINPLLAAKVAMYGAADAWTVSLVPLAGLGQKPNPTVPGPLNGILQGDLLKKVTESSGGVTFTSPVQVTGELVADTDQDATALGDVVKFLASMIQTSGGEAGSPVATLVQSLNVSTQGNILKLALAIPEAQLEALIQSGSHASGKKKTTVHI
jgi:hypothetical protein